MPGKSLEPSMDNAPMVLVGSLKGHKALPRRKHVVVEPTPTRHLVKEHVRSRSDQIKYSSTERIKSWIPDPSPIHVIPVVGVPLTTPIDFRDDFQSWIDDAALRRREFAKPRASDSSNTASIVQQSPPTSENTPPRRIHRAQAISSFSSSESRTESFETARENQSSDDEDKSPDSPSLHPSRQKWLRAAGLDTHKDVGLGLGLESEDEEATPVQTTPRRSPISRHFAAFDGAWDADMEDSKGYEVLTDPVKPAPFRTGYTHLRITSEPILDSPTLGKEPGASMKKSLSLRQRVEQSRHSPRNASTEKFAEQIKWPLKDNDFDMDTELRGMNTKRLSQVSTTSTVVSAMVINSPPRRRQTLRRTSKMLDLTTPPSNRNSLISNDHSLRRRLRRSGSPEQELRKSFASDSPDSLVPSVARSRQDTAPVIPQRRSSLQSSASGSKCLSNTFSLTSRQQSSRPTTAPEDTVGYFDIPRPRDRRTMSVVVHAATPVKCGAKGTETKATSIIGDPSPSSVPTSTEEPSTTTPVTGLDTFYVSTTPNTQPDPPHHLTDAQEARTPSIDRLRTGEWSAMRPRSTMVTPFSLRSAHSSTPGTLEVSEATAISIYPHTNKSILVIQQMASGSDSSPRERSAIITGEANIALPGPLIYHESPPKPAREPLNSPLQNPRDPPQPPQPPDLRVIAPTPANGLRSPQKPDSPTRTPFRKNRFSAPVSSLKRTFSARRPRSQSLVAPFTRTFSLRGTAGTPRRKSPIADGPDVKLHPFWRPRAYDGSDSDSEFGNTGYLNGSRVQSQARGEAPPGRTMSLTRRLSNSIRLSHHARRQRPSSVTMASDGDQAHEFGRPRIWEEGARTSAVMPAHTSQVRSVGFRGLAHMLEKRRQAKEEGKREERRQRLREKIGPIGKGSAGWEEVWVKKDEGAQ